MKANCKFTPLQVLNLLINRDSLPKQRRLPNNFPLSGSLFFVYGRLIYISIVFLIVIPGTSLMVPKVPYADLYQCRLT